MTGTATRRRAGRRAASLLLAFSLITAGGGCGKKEGQPSRGAPTAPEIPSANLVPGASKGDAAVSSRGGFSVVVTPSSPSRIAPPSVSVKSPPRHGADVLLVRWFVNGMEQESGPLLSPSRFQRGDTIRADVKLRAEGEEIPLTTPEVVAVNALPAVTDVRIEPRAPITGSTVRAIVQGQDPDGDTLKYKYKWFVNDLPGTGESESFALKGVKKGSWVYVSVTPNDGFADGAWKESPRYQVVNAPPVVKSPVPTTIPLSMMLRHTIVAEDPDGDPITFTLSKGPPGMIVKGSTIEWQVPESSVGTHVEAVVTISDNDGGQTVQTFAMTIRKN
ncbi:MAG: hypothetical protein ACYC24_02370 [Desulfobacteria bacterium]